MLVRIPVNMVKELKNLLQHWEGGGARKNPAFTVKKLCWQAFLVKLF